MKKFRNLRMGFTMVEVVLVLVILGVLAAIAIPKIASTTDDARIARIKHDMEEVVAALEQYQLNNGSIEDKSITDVVRANDSLWFIAPDGALASRFTTKGFFGKSTTEEEFEKMGDVHPCAMIHLRQMPDYGAGLEMVVSEEGECAKLRRLFPVSEDGTYNHPAVLQRVLPFQGI